MDELNFKTINFESLKYSNSKYWLRHTKVATPFYLRDLACLPNRDVASARGKKLFFISISLGTGLRIHFNYQNK